MIISKIISDGGDFMRIIEIALFRFCSIISLVLASSSVKTMPLKEIKLLIIKTKISDAKNTTCFVIFTSFTIEIIKISFLYLLFVYFHDFITIESGKVTPKSENEKVHFIEISQ